MKRLFCLIFLLISTTVYADKKNIAYNFPMYVGMESYNDFGVTLTYRNIDELIDIKSKNNFRFPGDIYFSNFFENLGNKNSFKEFINKNRSVKYSQQDFELIYSGTSWIRSADSIALKGYTEVGRFVFFILSVEGELKAVALERTESGYQMPGINESDYSYMIPLYILIESFSSNSNVSIKNDVKDGVCVIENSDSTCNLFLNETVKVFKGGDENENDAVSEFLAKSKKYILDELSDIGELFSNDFSETNRDSFLYNLSTLKPIVSIEFSNSFIVYFGERSKDGVELFKLVRLKKIKGKLEIQENNKFNLIDRMISNSTFINALVN